MTPRVSRRRLLRATGGAASVVGIARFGSVAATATRTADIYLGGATGAWAGRQPAAIADTDNPTLTLEEGGEYVIAWENVDAAPHNVVIENDAGDNLVESPLVSEKGRIQLVEFTATDEMTTYYCQVHPGSMEGSVEIVPPDSSEAIPTGGNVDVPDQSTPTATPTPTASPTPTATPTPTAASTPTATPTPTPASGGGATEETSGSGAGFGVVAAAAGLAGAIAGLARRRSE
ncbi:hypothetical protein BRC93_00285 [Halobacteriales archaeon QS_5_70_15]|nr:MAG: hypothetical protein BRC93_00285 [Halobacteriales archaeon QS_5_70_15]